MSDSSDEDVSQRKWVLYKDRPEWKDVEPVPQDDGEEPVVTIAYSKECKQIYSLNLSFVYTDAFSFG